MIGSTIGTYKITGTIGAGGMGEVFVGEDLMLERQVAIKQLRPELASRPDVVQRFRSEAVILAKLHHTNIATVYAFLQEGANFFLVMEYVQGWTLQNVIESQGVLAPAVAVGLFQQAMEGTGFAHRHHIIHRDLKPSNVMLTESGVLKVMDFGLARVLGAAHLTRTGRLVGTLEYISPEQIRGEETDARSDIYSLGIVLYELVTGRLPFESDSEYTLVRAQVETLPPSPRHITSAVSPELEQVILRALAKDPTERFQSIEEFSLALAHCAPQTNTREVLSALLAALKAQACQPRPPKSPPQAIQQTSPPAPAAARIKATRRAKAVGCSATELLSRRLIQACKNYLVPSLILASSVAAVGLLFFLGMPYAPSGSGLSPRSPGEVVVPPTHPLPVEPQAHDTRATPLPSASSDKPATDSAATAPRRGGQIGGSRIPASVPDPFPSGPMGVLVEKPPLPPPATGNALSKAEPSPLEEALPQPVVVPPPKESPGGEESSTAPLRSDDRSAAPPAVSPPPEKNTESKETQQGVPPQERKSSTKGREEATKGSERWYIRK